MDHVHLKSRKKQDMRRINLGRGRASQRNREFDNAFSGPVESFLPTRYNIRQPSEVYTNDPRPTIEDEFLPQFDDEIEPFLPPRSPSLGSISMDISNALESEGAKEAETVLGLVEAGRTVEVETGGNSDDTPGVGKLAPRLTDQLLRFHGCCNSCHVQTAQKHAKDHDIHHTLSSYMNLAKDSPLYRYSDILSSCKIASG